MNHLEFNDPSDLKPQDENVLSDHLMKQKLIFHNKKTFHNIASDSIYCDAPNSADESTPSLSNKVKIKLNVREKIHDRYAGPRRMRVRSSRQRTVTVGAKSCRKCNIGVDSIDWEREVSTGTLEPQVICARASDRITDGMCRICHGSESGSFDFGPLVSACCCRGTVGRIHVKCLERWLTESGKSRCELCGSRYATRRFHRYGVLKALLMWMLSQNTKQLLVDIFGIILMSPLAVLAAWLSGKTLSGLVNPSHPATPWPLASTFVLACMTLVCYYCWIVSAASRHALAWWIWYRSQYEVRLQLHGDDDD